MDIKRKKKKKSKEEKCENSILAKRFYYALRYTILYNF